MKSVIIAICLLIPLVIIFVIIDRKDFYSGNDVAVQQESVTDVKPAVEAKPVETKPVVETKPMAETKPVAEAKPKTNTKPAETNPVVETKPAEVKPVAETKTADTKPVAETKTDKPSKTKPVVQTKPEEKPAPAAVPVVTAEEAEKLNEFAIFLSTVKTTVVEGEITERSELPDPQKSDYPNCRFTVHFTGNTIKSGEPCPKELSLIVEGFENYRVLPSNDIKTGDKVLCAIFPFEQLPEDYQSTQQADDLELFLLESFYVLDIKTIKNFTDDELLPVSGIYFSDGNKDFVSLFDRHINPPLPDHVCSEQAFSVRKDIERMTLLLDEIDEENYSEVNKQFAEAWAREKAKDPPNYNRVGNYVWRNLENSFWTLPAGTNSILGKPDVISPQMLDCFLSLKQVLEANGVHLIVSLVPSMNVVSARVIVNEFKDVPDIQTATYVKQLSEIGVETIYASDQIIKNYNRYPFAFFIPENSHPSDTAQDVLADILVDRLKRYDIKPELNPTLFSEAQFPHCYKETEAYWFPENCDIGDNQAGKSYTCRDVLYNGEKIKRAKESPVMVIGNSFIETPISTPESLPALLSYKLCSPVDWYRISGYGPFSDILIQLLSNPDFYLKNKKVFIIQVGTMHITAVNRLETMLDIAKLDSERVLLNNKKVMGHLLLQSNASTEEIADPELWGPLSKVEKTVLKLDETGKVSYNFNVDQIGKEISGSDPIVCIIPHTCTPHITPPKATINQNEKIMQSPHAASLSRFVNLTYEFPAGTKEITMTIEGKPGTFIAIKDIQIWQ